MYSQKNKLNIKKKDTKKMNKNANDHFSVEFIYTF